VAENPRIEELRRRVQADPASIAFAALAEEFRRVGRFEDAIETCRTGLQRHPAYLSARVTLGRALLETGDYTGAREELETVLRSAPENLAAIRGLEQINERLGHSTEMHPDLHAIAKEATDARDARDTKAAFDLSLATLAAAERERAVEATPAPAPDPEPEPEPEPAAEPEASSDTGQAFDIFAAALQQQKAADAAPIPLSTSAPPPFDSPAFDSPAFDAPAFDAQTFDPPPLEPPTFAFEPATIAFEAPAFELEQPAPHLSAALLRLERFLDAIQSARHA
jgi:tetratricopeptide (TPR) repeat protein